MKKLINKILIAFKLKKPEIEQTEEQRRINKMKADILTNARFGETLKIRRPYRYIQKSWSDCDKS